MPPITKSTQGDFFAENPVSKAPVAKVVKKPQPEPQCTRCLETFLSDHQVAKRYGISRATLWRWVKSSAEFPTPVKLSPGTSRWKLSDLVAFDGQKEREAKTRFKAKRRVAQ